MANTPREYADYIRILRQGHLRLAEDVAAFHGINDVLEWMKHRSMERNPIDMIAQDEFEYDFIVQVAPGDGWLVFGVT
jgi:hypothetical protein